MANYEFCKAEKDDHLLIVTLNRPDVMNALHVHAHLELDQVFNDFEADPDLWVAIVTGAGDRAFSAGNDLKFQAQTVAAGKEMPKMPDSGFAGLTSRFDLSKPVIAAVNGVAMGGGFEIALACDLIIAAENAKFALPEPRVGLAAGAGGMQRLSQQIPLKLAMGMMLTGRHVPASEAFELGFVTEVVPQGDALKAARRWAEQILECSPVSIRTTKAVVSDSWGKPLSETIDTAHPAMKVLFKSEDAKEGPLAFSEKRPPNWKGR